MDRSTEVKFIGHKICLIRTDFRRVVDNLDLIQHMYRDGNGGAGHFTHKA